MSSQAVTIQPDTQPDTRAPAPSFPPLTTILSQGHSVQFYQDDRDLIDGLSLSIASSLIAGNSAIVIATKAHRTGLSAQLKARGLDTSLIVRQGRLRMLDAADTLAQFLVDGMPDAETFARLIGGHIIQLSGAAQGQSRAVAAYGEMVSLLWADGKHAAALELEQLWNRLAKTHSFHLHCAYPVDLFAGNDGPQSIQQISAEHAHVLPAIHPASSGDLSAMILLQQEARARDTESKDHRRAEEALYRLAAIVESSDDAIISKDLNGIVTSWNKSAERILGYKAEEIIGKSITLLIPPELLAEEVEILRRLRAGERIDHFQTVRATKGGERLDVSLTVSPVRDQFGRIIGAAKILRDITQQRKLEAALHTTERLASVGRLAATVAHEINNPLEAVINSVYLARRQPEISDDTRAYLDVADSELGRVAHIAQQTLGFYRDTSQPVSLSLAHVIEEVVAIYAARLRTRSIRLERRVPPDLTVFALQGEIKQVLSNLLANAIDACPNGGRIVISCRNFRLASGTDGVRVTVADNGAGIAPADQKRLFAPFFTTKQSFGTGLGLWITKDLLEKRGGGIRFRSSTCPAHSGTVMSFFLPAAFPSPHSHHPDSRR